MKGQNPFIEFACLHNPAAFTAPWDGDRRRLADAVDDILSVRPPECVRRALLVDRGVGTTTILQTAILWNAFLPRPRNLLYVTRESAAARSIAANVAFASMQFHEWRMLQIGGNLGVCRTLAINGAAAWFRGIHSDLRGLTWKGDDGQFSRAEVVLIDDPFTDEARHSVSHSARLLHILESIIPAVGSVAAPASILMATTDGRFLPTWSQQEP